MATYLHSGKLGRNDPCICGSGKKYKKCCLNETTEPEYEKHLFWESVKERYSDKQLTIVEDEETDMLKMSEVIIEYADELLNMATTEESQEQAIMIAIVAWNLAFFDEEQQEEQMHNLLHRLKIKQGSEDWHNTIDILTILIDRKRLDYPSIDRLIVDYKIIKTKGEFRLNIVSTVPQNSSLGKLAVRGFLGKH